MDFYERLFTLRKECGATQAQVAAETGMLPRQYQRYETGEQKPGFDNLVKLADYFSVSIDWLVGRTEKREVNR